MRVALVSDVHSNLIALDAVLEDLDKMGIDQILCAGDLIGYYPYPNETINRFRSRKIRSILGNHDRAVIRINPVGMNKMAAEAILWTAKHVSAESIDYLKGLTSRLRLEMGGSSLGLYHGSPRDDDEYLYEVDAGPELLEMCGCQTLVVGHTHMPYVRVHPSGAIVNAGSVGQPRDGDARSSYVIFDVDSGGFEMRRVPYDIEAVERDVQSAGLPPFLGERLRYGF